MNTIPLNVSLAFLFLLSSIPTPGSDLSSMKKRLGVDVISLNTPSTLHANYPALLLDFHNPVSKQQAGMYAFGDPAGCDTTSPSLAPQAMLAKVQEQLGDNLVLEQTGINYVWNGSLGSFFDISDDPFAYEFEVNAFQPPFTYRADQAVTIFVQNGFAVWLRDYGGTFRLLAVPFLPGVEASRWAEYASAYWRKDGLPEDDTILPVSKKLPCYWMIDQGIVSNETLTAMFDLDWQMPDYLAAGRKYLASTCAQAYRVSQEQIGWWDATSMCGPLTWQIVHDANSFPYRIGSYDADARLFIQANPRYWNGGPWNGFDPETYDLVVETNERMAGYDFQAKGDLYPGDILFSYGSAGQWLANDGSFSHIFMVAAIDGNNSRLAITNMVQNKRNAKDCFIREVVLYTPGDRETGVINYEWDDHGFGKTGHYGFDIFRWKWITFHLEGLPREYTVRWGETLETIAFDWKLSPLSIAGSNQLTPDARLTPGQIIILPIPSRGDQENISPEWIEQAGQNNSSHAGLSKGVE